MYFSMMPTLLLNLTDIPNAYKLVTDITSRVVASSEIRNNVFLYDEYTVSDGETPEIIASKAYKNPNLHWVILLCNEIIDPVYDWVMPQEFLLRHVIKTYGADHIHDIHHYEDANKNWVPFDYPLATPITNMEYEDQVNESKRKIRLLQPIYVEAFVDEVKKKLAVPIA